MTAMAIVRGTRCLGPIHIHIPPLGHTLPSFPEVAGPRSSLIFPLSMQVAEFGWFYSNRRREQNRLKKYSEGSLRRGRAPNLASLDKVDRMRRESSILSTDRGFQ